MSITKTMVDKVFDDTVAEPVLRPEEIPSIDLYMDQALSLFGVICQAIKHHVEMPGFFSGSNHRTKQRIKDAGMFAQAVRQGVTFLNPAAQRHSEAFYMQFFTLLTDRL